eukprot:2107104-Alexandrium_andersonii.AAC.1
MKPKLIGLPAGQPWHLRGSGPECAGLGRGCRSASPTSFRRSRQCARRCGFEEPLGGIFAGPASSGSSLCRSRAPLAHFEPQGDHTTRDSAGGALRLLPALRRRGQVTGSGILPAVDPRAWAHPVCGRAVCVPRGRGATGWRPGGAPPPEDQGAPQPRLGRLRALACPPGHRPRVVPGGTALR